MAYDDLPLKNGDFPVRYVKSPKVIALYMENHGINQWQLEFIWITLW